MISKDQVNHLGWLCRIELSESEIEKYTAQVEEIIKYLDKLDAIPLEEAKPIVIKKIFSDLRPDEPVKFEGNTLGTKYRKDGFVKGPRMV